MSKYSLFILKRKLEDVVIFPFVLIGRLIAVFTPPKKNYRICFFFPFYHTGGAEKVHSQIATATGGNDCIVYFTRRSVDKRFYDAFVGSGCELVDISRYTDNKWLYFMNLVYRGIISGRINKSRSTIVFNGQSNFGYKISRWLRGTQFELIHSFNTFSYIRVPFIPYYKNTVMISRRRIDDHLNMYQQYLVPEEYADRIIYIGNGIPIPAASGTKKEKTVLFVGRDSEEKRLKLFVEIARRVNMVDATIKFVIVGDVVTPELKNLAFIEYQGHADESKLDAIYERSSILVVPSSTEGFPMTVMEAMAHQMVILATPVGDLPLHIVNERNGWLFSSVEDEEQIINEAIAYIRKLFADMDKVQKIGATNRKHAEEHFDVRRFNSAYQELMTKSFSN